MTNSNENPLCTCPSGDGSLSHPCPMPPATNENELKVGDVIRSIIRDICELPDRSSPEDQPDLMLVTTSEMKEILERHIYDVVALFNMESRTVTKIGAELEAAKKEIERLRKDNGQLHDLYNAAHTTINRLKNVRMFPMQHPNLSIPWNLAEIIYAGYSALYGAQQSLERLAERGGFGWGEVSLIYRDSNTRGKRAIDAAMLKAAPKPEES